MLFGRNPTDFLISRQNIIDFRDSAMPDSPDTKSTHSSTLSPKAPIPSAVNSSGRPLSSNSSISGLNGHHSPLSTLNGRTPSPSGPLMNPSMGQQLPPACGARQLSKLKRFLTTLQQFGSDISPEIGERVRSLVLGLVNSHLSIEEFHSKLQEATNFPLRPFVIPFLKANLPLLQRELLHCARMAKQSPQQYLTQNEHVIFDPAHSPLDPRDAVAVSSEILNENGKRGSPDRSKENGLELHLEGPTLPTKRHHGSHSHPVSPLSGNRVSPGSAFNFSAGAPIRLEDISKSREMRERMEREHMDRERERVDRERERHFSAYSYRSNESFEHLDRIDDDWRHVETMLNCIMGMVDKTKRAVAVLQDRSVRDREELSLWSRRQGDGLDIGGDMKKRSSSSSDPMTFTLRQTEDRVSEVRRRAEEAVNDVKRQAMLELQKAMSAADQKALDLVAGERAKMERTLTDVRKQTQEDMLRTLAHQEESVESCWNCGRKASETCSGCNVARYCGSFCQHKDWENHHHVCGKAHITTVAEAREQRGAALAAAAAAAVAAGVSSTATSYTPSAASSLPSSTTSLSSSSASSSTSSSAVVTNASQAQGCSTRDTISVTSAPLTSLSPSSSPRTQITTTTSAAHVSFTSTPPAPPNLSANDSLVVPTPSKMATSSNPATPSPSSQAQDGESSSVTPATSSES